MAAAAARVILDTGAVIAWQRQRPHVVRYLTELMARSLPVVVPAVVLAECVRGGARDAPIHRLLASVRVTSVGARVAIAAGRLLAEAGMDATVDALVAAEAIRGGPCLVLTSDPADLGALIGKRSYVQVIAI
ncbi:MAG TPA: PIN domain-containing protein [Actinomycetes bacterium]|jgi:predicted nucleic acid-binding protein|nr:PIN domain-containing protein [Actinomycetes bacterium]